MTVSRCHSVVTSVLVHGNDSIFIVTVTLLFQTPRVPLGGQARSLLPIPQYRILAPGKGEPCRPIGTRCFRAQSCQFREQKRWTDLQAQFELGSVPPAQPEIGCPLRAALRPNLGGLFPVRQESPSQAPRESFRRSRGAFRKSAALCTRLPDSRVGLSCASSFVSVLYPQFD